MPQRIKRVPSADWRTENLEDLWKKSKPLASACFHGSLHQFLEYCCLLRSIRQQFEIDDRAVGFDDYAFFLRGGYFAFKYLNMTSSMALKATIFGGLNHGRNPKLELPGFLNEFRKKALSRGKHCARLLIVDEVKSGSGMSAILTIVKESMSGWPDSSRCDIYICFYAIRPGPADQMTGRLQAAVSKWQGKHETNGGLLVVDIKHFAGPLPGYDCDRLCGVKRVSSSADQSEAYEIFKSVGGTVTLSCDVTKKHVFEASIGRGSLVEFLSSCAVAWTDGGGGTQSKNLAQRIRSFGCFSCRKLRRKAAGQRRRGAKRRRRK